MNTAGKVGTSEFSTVQTHTVNLYLMRHQGKMKSFRTSHPQGKNIADYFYFFFFKH